MTFGKPIRRASLISQVTEQLREEICSGRWAVGEKIPTETALSELTGTGRNTVREAVQALVHTGLLERRQGSGTYVVATSDVGGTLGKYFAGAHERDVLELRQALDVTAATLAARRRTPEDVARLEDLQRERRRLWEESATDAAITADVALHRAIVEASHNAVYLEFYDSLLPAIEHTVDQHVHATGEGFHEEHERLVRAVIDGDEHRASLAARDLFAELLD
ncbi:GntR family transcriptional regulator [Rhodococcus oxybenzonivorans]|uniref:GntR family transcriptional regulator n=1 Tax=Rhodococcus oxybenzonivorans TaxID=1990687 RepID=A0A2S2BXF9_9NOCA|nr:MULTISPECIES: FadR/GntR family transcriptional regulator [Rhodococcus]AWK73330.1 GntR family transcriptional regulator [Rhodococcus oxybenzonivorans]QTJ69036.1 FadR family transcriptional regulator [Rhodococcus sp. ZPP]